MKKLNAGTISIILNNINEKIISMYTVNKNSNLSLIDYVNNGWENKIEINKIQKG